MTVSIFTALASAVWPDSTTIDPSDIRTWGGEVEGALNALFAFGPPMYNGKLVATVAANVLTIAVKTAANADASGADPVYFGFRDETIGDGNFDIKKSTAALSMTVAATALLGTVNSTAFRLWVVVFNDGGTLRLGVVNCLSISGTPEVTQIYPLDESGLASSTAEGDDGSADAALIVYTGTAVTSKPFRILGYLTWNSGLATAGNWSAVPSVIQPFGPGIREPGDRVQLVRKADGAVATGTTTMVADDSIPQNDEGDEYLSQAITPVSAANLLGIRVRLMLSSNAAEENIAALFQDSTADALAAASQKNTAKPPSTGPSGGRTMLPATSTSPQLLAKLRPIGAGLRPVLSGGPGSA